MIAHIIVGVIVLVPVAVAARAAWGIHRFARLSREGKRNYPAALRAAVTWRWLCRNAGLAYHDQHLPRILGPSGRTSVRVRQPANAKGTAKLRYPKARIRPDHYGLVANVRTIPRVGRVEFEKASESLANHWKCVRVQVSQPKPGRILLRGLRHDPLTDPFTEAEAPPGVFTGPGLVDLRKLQLYLGRDEWGEHRHVPLSGVAGITIGGMPGFGKTEFVKSIIRQLAPLPAKFIFIDGKGSFDYDEYRDRAWLCVGDDLADAAGALEAGHDEMRRRLGSILDLTGGATNGWHVGPSPGLELLVTIIDECHTFYDLDGIKGDKDAEKLVRQCRMLSGQLAKKGRSALCVTIYITQKQDSTAIPTAIRDQCAVGMSFAVRTKDAAVCALGEAIKDYGSYCPTTLQDPAYVGVMSARLASGADPFTRIRVPQLARASLPVRIPDDASSLVPSP